MPVNCNPNCKCDMRPLAMSECVKEVSVLMT